MRHEQDIVPEGLYAYYQDVYDHILRVSESSDSLRDLVTAIVETNFSLRDYRQNLIVKKVSGWAAVLAVPALTTGYYGMNLPYPGSGEISGDDLVDAPDHRSLPGPLFRVQAQRLVIGETQCSQSGNGVETGDGLKLPVHELATQPKGAP